jgi:hypothetical protein
MNRCNKWYPKMKCAIPNLKEKLYKLILMHMVNIELIIGKKDNALSNQSSMCQIVYKLRYTK